MYLRTLLALTLSAAAVATGVQTFATDTANTARSGVETATQRAERLYQDLVDDPQNAQRTMAAWAPEDQRLVAGLAVRKFNAADAEAQLQLVSHGAELRRRKALRRCHLHQAYWKRGVSAGILGHEKWLKLKWCDLRTTRVRSYKVMDSGATLTVPLWSLEKTEVVGHNYGWEVRAVARFHWKFAFPSGFTTTVTCAKLHGGASRPMNDGTGLWHQGPYRKSERCHL